MSTPDPSELGGHTRSTDWASAHIWNWHNSDWASACIKLPSSNSSASLDPGITSPTAKTILEAVHIFILPNGRSWTWTQNLTLWKTKPFNKAGLKNLFSATKFLSKDHGSPTRIFSISVYSLKANRTQWFPISLTSKPFLVCQSNLKVLAIASMLSTLLVKNLATNKYGPSMLLSLALYWLPLDSDKDKVSRMTESFSITSLQYC